ncbi:nickel insertion protein [Desulfoscipio gibsoniae]|uniref:nickel insertion protein n=1 Tax=Desulfoscipio gibsoniae TaxID=102134 RepID=UPI000232A9E9|nr:nickel insertion protein [Desulfoscipio gibsoniae]
MVYDEEVLVMETAIDDQNPEFFPYLVDRLLEAGALDAYLQPIIMKKGRPGTLLTVLAREDRQDILLQIIFSETSTLGVRLRTERRLCLHRDFITVHTGYGAVRVKLALEEPGGAPLRYAPEFEDCRALALEHRVPVQNVYRAALLAAENMLKDQ